MFLSPGVNLAINFGRELYEKTGDNIWDPNRSYLRTRNTTITSTPSNRRYQTKGAKLFFCR